MHALIGHDKVILCLTTAHTSNCNILNPTFFIKTASEAFFVPFVNVYQHTFLVTFDLILLYLLYLIV